MSQTLIAYSDSGHSGEGRQAPTRHDTFWIADLGLVYLQAESTIYRVHSWFLIRDSAVFRDIFDHLGRSPQSGEGLTEQRPIHLNGTSKIELDSLFTYYYFGMRPDYNPTVRTWMHLLEVSNRFMFGDLRAAAIAALTVLKDGPNGIAPIHKLQLALKFDITHWFDSAYRDLVKSAEPLDVEDAIGLPVQLLLLLTRSRELYRERDNWVQSGNEAFPVKEAEVIVNAELLRLGIDYTGRRLQN